MQDFDGIDNITEIVKAIQITVDLKEYTPNDAELDSNTKKVTLRAKQVLLLDVGWKQICDGFDSMVQWDEVKAKFVRKKNLLKITCPLRTSSTQ